MKLKTFEKTNVSVRTEYIVFRGIEPIDHFHVNYTDISKDGLDNLTKRQDLEKAGARVRFVCVNSATGELSVTVEVE